MFGRNVYKYLIFHYICLDFNNFYKNYKCYV